jgi:hypothetical protein
MLECEIDYLSWQKRLVYHAYSFTIGIFLPPHSSHVPQVLFFSHRRECSLVAVKLLRVWYHTWMNLGKCIGHRFVPPISTNFKASDIDDFYKYATMIINKSRKRFFHELSTFIMLLIALIVRSTTQKDEKAFPHPQ